MCCELDIGSFERIVKQHGDGQWADPSRNRSDGSCLLGHRFTIDVTYKLVPNPVNSDVVDYCAFSHHLASYKTGLSDGGDQYIGLSCHRCKVDGS